MYGFMCMCVFKITVGRKSSQSLGEPAADEPAVEEAPPPGGPAPADCSVSIKVKKGQRLSKLLIWRQLVETATLCPRSGACP